MSESKLTKQVTSIQMHYCIYLKFEYDLLCFSKLQLYSHQQTGRHVWSSDHVHYQGELGIVEIE